MLHHQVHRNAASLRNLGVGSGDRVAVVLPNGPAAAVAFLSVATVSVCAPLNPAYTADEFDYFLKDLDAVAVLVPFGEATPVRDVAEARGVAVLEFKHDVGRGRFELVFDAPAIRPSPGEVADPQSVALVLHTSGTTARPKMIALSHTNLCASAANIRSVLRLTGDDVCLNVMPLFHIHGLIGALLSTLSAGGCVACTTGFSPVLFYDWLKEFNPTWYTAVPTMHQEVLARAAANRDTIAASRLRFIRSSSAALPPVVMSEMENAFGVPVIEAFGMTEASHQIASNPLPPGRRKPGSVGLASGCEVAIMDERGRLVPLGASGEIAIRGPNVTRSRGASGAEAVDAIWLRTGDLGYLDEDGYLFICGRIKEIINRGAEKIAPAEIDQILLEHPAVDQAVTCAVPDARLGEDMIAVVVRRPGSTLTERELRSFASTRLAAFKVPRRVTFVNQIPKGPTGKIQRIGLAKKLGIESSTFVRSTHTFVPPRTATEMAMAQVWRDVLKVDRVGLYDNFFEIGGDSLAAAEASMRVQKRFGIALNIRALAVGTLEQMAMECEGRTAAIATAPSLPSMPVRWGKTIIRRWWSSK
jgi:acyl-CoA synthetase (AMP-forming)/AMP-acid ligase II